MSSIAVERLASSHDNKVRFMVTADQLFVHMAGPEIARLVIEAVAARFADEAHADFVREALPHMTPERLAELTMDKIGARLEGKVQEVKQAIKDKPVGGGSSSTTVVNRYSLF